MYAQTRTDSIYIACIIDPKKPSRLPLHSIRVFLTRGSESTSKTSVSKRRHSKRSLVDISPSRYMDMALPTDIFHI